MEKKKIKSYDQIQDREDNSYFIVYIFRLLSMEEETFLNHLHSAVVGW